ncbi:MAG: hypothetical protein AB3N22_17985 [Ruegeria sp.]
MTETAAKPRLVIHLGYHKSGSAAIQRWLLTHADALAPHLTTFNLFDGSTKGLKLATNRLVLSRATEQQVRNQSKLLRAKLDKVTTPTICITDESLPGLPLGWRDDTYEETEIYPRAGDILRLLAEEFADYAPTFVVFEPEADPWLRSIHDKMSKQGSITEPLSDYLARVAPVVDWPALRQTMTEAIGTHGTLVAYPFEAEFAKDAVRDMGFFQLLDLPDSVWDACAPGLEMVNASAPDAQIEQLDNQPRPDADRQVSGLRPGEIQKAYQLLLGRTVESPEAIKRKQALPNLKELGRQIMRSDEFARRYNMLRTPDEIEDPAVIHLHIPKTAGSSFTSILSDSFADKRRFGYQDITSFSALPEIQRQRIDLVFGHLYYGLHDMLRPNYLYLFVLREPKARVYSFFKYVQKAADHPLHRIVNAQKFEFGDFLTFADTSPGGVAEIDNGQMMRVAGHTSIAEVNGDYAAAFRTACQHAIRPTTEFGLVEDFSAFLERLKARGVVAPGTVSKTLNTTGSADTLAEALATLTPQQTDILDRYTAWDRRFYQVCATYLGGLAHPETGRTEES